jgi:hypothetical protein
MRAAILSTLIIAASSQASVMDCAAGNSIFKIDGLNFSPVDVVAGQNGTLHTQYTVPETVSAGTAIYTCSINGLPFSQSYDICTQTACPIAAGYHDDYSKTQVPDVSGKVVCKIEWRDLSDKELLCVQMTFRLAAARKALRGCVRAYEYGIFSDKHYHYTFNDTYPVVKYTPPIQFLSVYGPQPYVPSDE